MRCKIKGSLKGRLYQLPHDHAFHNTLKTPPHNTRLFVLLNTEIQSKVVAQWHIKLAIEQVIEET
jgi:hypothetical protein